MNSNKITDNDQPSPVDRELDDLLAGTAPDVESMSPARHRRVLQRPGQLRARRRAARAFEIVRAAFGVEPGNVWQAVHFKEFSERPAPGGTISRTQHRSNFRDCPIYLPC